MKLPFLSSCVAVLVAVLFLGACSAPKVDPNAGVPTGLQYVIARYGDGGESHQLAARVQGMAVQHPRRPAFETAVSQQIRLGELKVSKLEVTYTDGTAKVFK